MTEDTVAKDVRSIRVGRVRVTPAFLLMLLGFSPKECRLLTVAHEDDWRIPPSERLISLVISGPMMPEVGEGNMAPEVEVEYLQRERGLPEMVGVTRKE